MRYLFVNNIFKLVLLVVGGNKWFVFFGMLYWMMNLVKMMEVYLIGVYDEVCIEVGYDVSVDRIIF